MPELTLKGPTGATGALHIALLAVSSRTLKRHEYKPPLSPFSGDSYFPP